MALWLGAKTKNYQFDSGLLRDGASNWRAPSQQPPRKGHSAALAASPFRGKARSDSKGRYFLKLSLISRNRTMSSAGGAGALGGGAGGLGLRRLICLIIMKMMNARMMKLTATVRKFP